MSNISSTPDTPMANGTSNETSLIICQQILFQHLGDSSVRLWDLGILVPNLVFAAFLVYKFRRIRQKLALSRSPVFRAFYGLVYLSTVVNVTRCLVSFCLTVESGWADGVDKFLWLVLKFCLLSAELCVLTFALFFGQMESGQAMRRVVAATLVSAGLFTVLQSILEFAQPVKAVDFFDVPKDQKLISPFTHGGAVFWCLSSLLFCVLYAGVTAAPRLLPLTRWADRFSLPKKPRFYAYTATLAGLNGFQVLGTWLMLGSVAEGMCLVDLTSFLYFAFFTPLVYFTFLKGYLKEGGRHGSLFSYRLHYDDPDPLPSSLPVSPAFQDVFVPDAMEGGGGLGSGLNPLYAFQDGPDLGPQGHLAFRGTSEDHSDQPRIL